MSSGNDAAYALAEAGGGREATLAAMNERAAQLGAHDTVAKDPSGLDAPGQTSSAYDLALIGRAALAVPGLPRVRRDQAGRLPRPGRPEDQEARAATSSRTTTSCSTTTRAPIGLKNGYTEARQPHLHLGGHPRWADLPAHRDVRAGLVVAAAGGDVRLGRRVVAPAGGDVRLGVPVRRAGPPRGHARRAGDRHLPADAHAHPDDGRHRHRRPAGHRERRGGPRAEADGAAEPDGWWVWLAGPVALAAALVALRRRAVRRRRRRPAH